MGVLFSVIIPVYNKADTISRTLKSVREQALSDCELIIVDDGSKDSSISVAQSCIKDFPCSALLVRQTNKGVSAARNLGAKHATGRYLAFLDADDFWSSSHLSDLKNVLERFPNAKVISSNIGFVYDDRVTSFGDGDNFIKYSIYDKLQKHEPIHTSSFAVDRELFLSVGGYDESYSYYEDSELCFRLGDVVGDFYATMKVSAFYTHDATETATGGHKRREPSSFAHLMFIEKRIANGVGSKVTKCGVRLLFRKMLYMAKCGDIGDLCDYRQTYYSIYSAMGVLRHWVLSSKWIAKLLWLVVRCYEESFGAILARRSNKRIS